MGSEMCIRDRISFVPDAIWELPGLHKIYLSDTKVSVLPTQWPDKPIAILAEGSRLDPHPDLPDNVWLLLTPEDLEEYDSSVAEADFEALLTEQPVQPYQPGPIGSI